MELQARKLTRNSGQWMRNTILGALLISLAATYMLGEPATQPLWVLHQSPDESGAYYAGPEVSPPKLVRVMPVPNPGYTSGKRAQGVTAMAMVIGADGVPDQVRVLHSHGYVNDQAAMAAIRMSVYEPGKLGGKPVPVWIDARVVFRAKQSSVLPELVITERDLPAPRESFFEDKKHRPANYTPPVIIRSADADFAEPLAKKPPVQVATVTVTVGADGLPKDATMRRGQGSGFDNKALEAVKHYRFLPATRKGVPVEEITNVKVPFVRF
jgi:TonB family protein